MDKCQVMKGRTTFNKRASCERQERHVLINGRDFKFYFQGNNENKFSP